MDDIIEQHIGTNSGRSKAIRIIF